MLYFDMLSLEEEIKVSIKQSKYNYKRAIIGPPAKRHLMAFRWRDDDTPKLIAGMVALCFFQGIRETLYFCDFSGGSGPPVHPYGCAYG